MCSARFSFYVPTAQQPFHPYFDSTQDLLSRFQLLSAYDKYVRPYAAPVGAPGAVQPQAIPSASDKGKGKEREVLPRDIASPAAAQTPGAGNDGDDGDGQGKGDKKWKNNYRHLIKGIPGAWFFALAPTLWEPCSNSFRREALDEEGRLFNDHDASTT